ncbi:MAG: isopentenyl-diphosphate Delta-isomerase [Geminicoccaceae bacterium]
MPGAPKGRPKPRIDVERVMLVDAEDRVIGTAEKHAAHLSGALHRAFSVLIHDPAGKWLLQRRSPGKYHSGGLWTNAACGHPRPGEATEAAAGRRLEEELGFVCPLAYLTKVYYHSPLDHGMTEHELVSIYTGLHAGPVEPDPAEADAVRWIEPTELRRDLDAHPDRYTVWFRKYVTELWATLRAA